MKTWFQNRRMKHKKVTKKSINSSTSSSTSSSSASSGKLTTTDSTNDDHQKNKIASGSLNGNSGLEANHHNHHHNRHRRHHNHRSSSKLLTKRDPYEQTSMSDRSRSRDTSSSVESRSRSSSSSVSKNAGNSHESVSNEEEEENENDEAEADDEEDENEGENNELALQGGKIMMMIENSDMKALKNEEKQQTAALYEAMMMQAVKKSPLMPLAQLPSMQQTLPSLPSSLIASASSHPMFNLQGLSEQHFKMLSQFYSDSIRACAAAAATFNGSSQTNGLGIGGLTSSTSFDTRVDEETSIKNESSFQSIFNQNN